MSLRDQILAAPDLKRQTVEVPEWGVSVEIRELSIKGRMQWRETAFEERDGESTMRDDWAVRLVMACVFDPATGARVFGPEDADSLAEKADGPIATLLNVVLDLNGMRADTPSEAVDFTAGTPSSDSSTP